MKSVSSDVNSLEEEVNSYFSGKTGRSSVLGESQTKRFTLTSKEIAGGMAFFAIDDISQYGSVVINAKISPFKSAVDLADLTAQMYNITKDEAISGDRSQLSFRTFSFSYNSNVALPSPWNSYGVTRQTDGDPMTGDAPAYLLKALRLKPTDDPVNPYCGQIYHFMTEFYLDNIVEDIASLSVSTGGGSIKYCSGTPNGTRIYVGGQQGRMPPGVTKTIPVYRLRDYSRILIGCSTVDQKKYIYKSIPDDGAIRNFFINTDSSEMANVAKSCSGDSLALAVVAGGADPFSVTTTQPKDYGEVFISFKRHIEEEELFTLYANTLASKMRIAMEKCRDMDTAIQNMSGGEARIDGYLEELSKQIVNEVYKYFKGEKKREDLERDLLASRGPYKIFVLFSLGDPKSWVPPVYWSSFDESEQGEKATSIMDVMRRINSSRGGSTAVADYLKKSKGEVLAEIDGLISKAQNFLDKTKQMKAEIHNKLTGNTQFVSAINESNKTLGKPTVSTPVSPTPVPTPQPPVRAVGGYSCEDQKKWGKCGKPWMSPVCDYVCK